MQDKTIREIANNPRVQEAFLERFNATAEQRLHPRAFVVNAIRQYIKDIVQSSEVNRAITEVQQSTAQAEDLVL